MKKTKKVLYGILSTSVVSLSLTGCSTSEQSIKDLENVETTVTKSIEEISENIVTEDTENIDNIDFDCDHLVEIEDEVFQCQDENSQASGYYYSHGSWFPTFAALLAAGYVLDKRKYQDSTTSGSSGGASSGIISSNQSNKNNVNSNQSNESSVKSGNSSSIQSNPAQSGMGRSGGSIGS